MMKNTIKARFEMMKTINQFYVRIVSFIKLFLKKKITNK